jgi:hypothetical protein
LKEGRGSPSRPAVAVTWRLPGLHVCVAGPAGEVNPCSVTL